MFNLVNRREGWFHPNPLSFSLKSFFNDKCPECYSTPGPVLSVLQWTTGNYSPIRQMRKTKAQKGYMPCPRLHNCKMMFTNCKYKLFSQTRFSSLIGLETRIVHKIYNFVSSLKLCRMSQVKDCKQKGLGNLRNKRQRPSSHDKREVILCPQLFSMMPKHTCRTS